MIEKYNYNNHLIRLNWHTPCLFLNNLVLVLVSNSKPTLVSKWWPNLNIKIDIKSHTNYTNISTITKIKHQININMNNNFSINVNNMNIRTKLYKHIKKTLPSKKWYQILFSTRPPALSDHWPRVAHSFALWVSSIMQHYNC